MFVPSRSIHGYEDRWTERKDIEFEQASEDAQLLGRLNSSIIHVYGTEATRIYVDFKSGILSCLKQSYFFFLLFYYCFYICA